MLCGCVIIFVLAWQLPWTQNPRLEQVWSKFTVTMASCNYSRRGCSFVAPSSSTECALNFYTSSIPVSQDFEQQRLSTLSNLAWHNTHRIGVRLKSSTLMVQVLQQGCCLDL